MSTPADTQAAVANWGWPTAETPDESAAPAHHWWSRTWPALLALSTVGAVGVPAAVASYRHARDVIATNGDPVMAPWLPLSVDGMLVAALVVIWVRRHRGDPAGVFPWLAFGFGMVVTILANLAAVAQPRPGQRLSRWRCSRPWLWRSPWSWSHSSLAGLGHDGARSVSPSLHRTLRLGLANRSSSATWTRSRNARTTTRWTGGPTLLMSRRRRVRLLPSSPMVSSDELLRSTRRRRPAEPLSPVCRPSPDV
ncbi:DUF2637 domain-containing protein [Microbacterium sp. HSID17254]|nr:DUF2637 domain-containing protein [Microbacterium sp. HSID17254]